MLSRSVLHFYQIPSKYFKGYSNYRVDMKSISKTKKEDNSRSQKARVVIFVRKVVSFCSTLISIKYHNIFYLQFLSSIIKIFICSTYRVDTKSMHNHCQIKQREITPTKADLSFLYTTRFLILFYISTMYHQNIKLQSRHEIYFKICRRVFKLQSGHKIYFKQNRVK